MWVPNFSKFSSNLRIKFKFERRHLISVHCIVLLERLPVTRQQQPGGAGWQQWWLLTPYGQTQVTCMVRHYTGRHSDIVHIVISDWQLTRGMTYKYFRKPGASDPWWGACMEILPRATCKNLTCHASSLAVILFKIKSVILTLTKRCQRDGD